MNDAGFVVAEHRHDLHVEKVGAAGWGEAKSSEQRSVAVTGLCDCHAELKSTGLSFLTVAIRTSETSTFSPLC